MTNQKLGWKKRVWGFLHAARWVLLGLLVVLCLVRLYLPTIVERYVNKQINKAKDYGGGIQTVHLQLWRGQYRIDGIKIFKKEGDVHSPLFSSDHLFLAVEWKELFHGSVVGQVIMERPELNIVAGPTAAQTQTGTNEGWDKILSSLFPFDLNRFEIHDGQVHFKNEHSTPPVDIYLRQLSVTATNLNNSRDLKNPLPAGIKAKSTTLGGGGLDLNVQLNPLAKAPTYQLTAQLTNVDLPSLNPFLRAYGKFDVERGDFAVFASVASKEGVYDGYIKVFFKDLKVFAWEKERKKNALEVFWQAIVGAVTTVLKNPNTDTLATRIPISGSYDGTKVGTWTAVSQVLRNAFIRALVPKVDEKVTVQDVEVKKEEKIKLQDSPPPVRAAEQQTRSSTTNAP